MGTRDAYEAGTPCWVDVAVDDVGGATSFYRQLFGWEPEASEVDGVTIYTNLRLDGSLVAGLSGKMGQPMPDAWSLYVATDDVAATLAAVTGAGGQVMVGPEVVPGGAGTFGVFADPNGAICGAWRAGNHHGAGLVNEPGTFVWNELASPDVNRSVAFYTSVFGWETTPSDGGDGTIFRDGTGRELCGAHPAGPGEPTFWSIWFAVEDCDSTVARVGELGGQVLMAPTDMSFGRGAVVAAPGGAAFGVAAMVDADD